jgi:hypothetical protein
MQKPINCCKHCFYRDLKAPKCCIKDGGIWMMSCPTTLAEGDSKCGLENTLKCNGTEGCFRKLEVPRAETL